MKQLLRLIVVLMLCIAFLMLISCNTVTDVSVEHACKYEHCPYKGVKPSQWRDAASKLSPEGSDSYCIDLLHLEHPDKEYEELEDLLFLSKSNIL